jgi:hypothetical protein
MRRSLLILIATAFAIAVHPAIATPGTLDPRFSHDGIALQPNGKTVAAGETWVNGVPRFLVIRLTA